MARRPQEASGPSAVEAWNEAHPIGTPVRYTAAAWKGRGGKGPPRESRTRSAASDASGVPVVWIEGVKGCVALASLEVIEERAEGVAAASVADASSDAVASAPEMFFAERARLRASPTNPRKRFRGLEELAASVLEKGVLQPLLVRAWPGEPDVLEVVCGERRHRAADAAGLDLVPVIKRELSDVEVLEIQIVENDQREDVHPLEEADGFCALRDQHGRTIEEIATRIGRPTAYVYRRLSLCSLGAKAREAFFEGAISTGVAEVLARIPAGEVQDKALKELLPRHEDDTVTVRDARRHVRERYMLKLADAQFDTADTTLVPEAGACATCPTRTGAQAVLFGETDKDDLCTNIACWDRKREAGWARQRAEAELSGKRVLAEAEAKKLFPSQWGGLAQGSGYVDLDQGSDQYGYGKKWRAVLGKKRTPETVLARNPHSGKVHELVQRDAVKRAMAADPRPSDPTPSGRPAQPDHVRKAQEKAKAEAAGRRLLFAAVGLAAQERFKGLKLEERDAKLLLRVFAALLRMSPLQPRKELIQARGWELTKTGKYETPDTEGTIIRGAVDLSDARLVALTIELVVRGIGEAWQESLWKEADAHPARMLAKELDVDVDACLAEAKAELAAKKKAKASKKAAKKAGAKAAAEKTPAAAQQEARTAPAEGAPSPPKRRTCSNCGQQGHNARGCARRGAGAEAST